MGRKKMVGTDAQRAEVRLRLDMDLMAKLQAIAKDEHSSVAAVVRSAVIKDLKRREKENEV